MRLRTGYSSYLATTLDYRESKPIEPARLDGLVTRLRDGDITVAPEIIKGHLRMVAAIVGETVKARRKAEDAMGAALLSLTEAVMNASTRLYDNNITAYITTTVRYAIKDHLANDHIVRVPNRTVRHKLAQGETFEEIVPGDPGAIETDDHSDDIADWDGSLKFAGDSGFVLPYVIPIAPPPDPRETLEFQEALNKAAEGTLNAVVLRLRVEGFGYEEIGRRVGLSTARVGQIVPGMIARLTALVK